MVYLTYHLRRDRLLRFIFGSENDIFSDVCIKHYEIRTEHQILRAISIYTKDNFASKACIIL